MYQHCLCKVPLFMSMEADLDMSTGLHVRDLGLSCQDLLSPLNCPPFEKLKAMIVPNDHNKHPPILLAMLGACTSFPPPPNKAATNATITIQPNGVFSPSPTWSMPADTNAAEHHLKIESAKCGYPGEGDQQPDLPQC